MAAANAGSSGTNNQGGDGNTNGGGGGGGYYGGASGGGGAGGSFSGGGGGASWFGAAVANGSYSAAAAGDGSIILSPVLANEATFEGAVAADYVQNQTAVTQPANFRIGGTGTAARLGLNTTAPFGQLANTPTNIVGSDGQGGNGNSLAWTSGSGGYVGMFYNSNTTAGGARNGLAVKVAGTDANSTVLDLSTGPAQATTGTVLFRVRANGRVGVGVGSPNYPLDVAGDINSSTLLRTGGSPMVYRVGNNVFLGTSNYAATAPTGANNTLVGANGGAALTTGYNNTTVGLANGDAITEGYSNTLVGVQAGGGLTTGFDNVFIGHDPGRYSVGGGRNVGIGSFALINAEGNENVALGYNGGLNLTTGADNTFVGTNTGLSASAAQHSRATAVGYNAKVNQDDAVVLGDAANAAVRVGIGTTQPSQKLDVNGTARLRGLAAAGIVTNLADGTLGTATAAALDATTAGSGLTLTGTEVVLGGTLAQNTTLTQNGSSLALVGAGATAQQIIQPASNTTTTVGSGVGQSFVLPAGATVTRVDVYGDVVTKPFIFYQGVPGGTVLRTQTVTYNAAQALTSIVLTPALTVGAAGTYSFNTGNNSAFAASNANPYGGGSFYSGNAAVATTDLKFAVYYTTAAGSAVPTLYAGSAGTVGIGTDAPTATLDVAGAARVRGLTTPGIVTTDVLGNLGTATAAALDATTAGNGLTRTGTEVVLGGTLAQNTTLTTGGNSLSLAGTGRLGVGTTAPAYPLDVVGDVNTSTLVRTGGVPMLYRRVGAGSNANMFVGTGDYAATAPAGFWNTFVGEQGGTALGGGYGNTALGRQAGKGLTDGTWNTLLGNQAGMNLTTGNLNAYVGHHTGENSSGDSNVGVGTVALRGTTGNNNTALGNAAGEFVTGGAGNALLGHQAGRGVTTGANNTLLGTGADLSSTGTQRSRATALGYRARVDQDDAVVLGDPANAAVRVGIGTAQPASRLEVAGTVAPAAVGTEGLLRLTRPDNDGVKYPSTAEWQLGTYEASATSVESRSRLDLRLGNGATYDPEATVLTVQGNGNVGIGTTAPAARLHVAGTAGTPNVRLESLGSATPGTRVVTAAANGELGTSDGSGSFVLNQSTANQAASFRIGGNGYVGGNVGIGTTTPVAPLDVLPAGGNNVLLGGGNLTGAELKLLRPGVAHVSLYNNTGALTIARTSALSSPNVTGTTLMVVGSNSAGTGLGDNVGIGTATPVTRLDVQGDQNLTGTLKLNTTDVDKIFYTTAGATGSKLGHAVGWGVLNYAGPGSGATTGYHSWLTTISGAYAERMRLNETGLGIGTTAPAAALDVQAGTPLLGTSATLTANDAPSTQLRLTRPGTSGTKWNSSAELAVGTFATGVNARSQLDIKLGQNNNNAADQTVMTLRGDGRVGIGTATPGAALEVAGQVKVTGGSPAAGRVLTSDAAGLATWQNPAPSATTVTGDAATRMLYGIFRNDLAVVSGTGFTVVRSGTGLYTVTFGQGFATIPAVSFSTNNDFRVRWAVLDNGYVTIAVLNGTNVLTDMAAGQFITFTAVGGR